MKKALASALALCLVCLAGAPALAAELPRVFVDNGNSSFYGSCHTDHWANFPKTPKKSKRICSPPGPLEIRPKVIEMSADGDGWLSNLDWLVWTSTAAGAIGLQNVRCWPPPGKTWPLPPGVPNAACPGGSGAQDAYMAPVAVSLSVPIASSRGLVFTFLTVTRSSGPVQQSCLPPASRC